VKRFFALLLSLAFLLAGCGGSDADKEKLPEGKALLNQSAGAMLDVTSVAFTLNVEGRLSTFQVKDATGVIRSDGKAKATAQVSQGGRLVEYQYVLVDGKTYLKGATGGFQEVPATIAARIFNPTALLTGEKSLSKGLAKSRNAKTEAEEKVDDVDAYRVKAKINPADVEGLTLLASGSSQEATLWIAKDMSHLVKAVLPFKLTEREETVVTVTFSDFNENVEITPPI
jgi:lipoprotein LprG